MMSNFDWPWETLEPGIYFDLPFDEYKKQRCINSSSIKQILISETNFWCDSWMNPLREDKDTDALRDGRAYHTRILEGKDVFYDHYADKYEDDGDPDMIRTSDDIKQALKQYGAPTSFKRKIDGAIRLLDADPNARILDIEKHDYEKKHEGKELLDAKTIRYIELTAKIIEFHPEMKSWLVGGYPEVTVIWDDPHLGVRCKSRLDYLKIGQIVDLKTFANQLGKSVDKAIEREIANHRYHIPAYFYLRSAKQAKILARDGKIFNSDHVDQEWINQFVGRECNDFWFIFLQKGNSPVARGAKWSKSDKRFMGTSKQVVEEACERFLRAYNTFGEDAWLDINRAVNLSFDSLPSYITDI